MHAYIHTNTQGRDIERLNVDWISMYDNYGYGCACVNCLTRYTCKVF